MTALPAVLVDSVIDAGPGAYKLGVDHAGQPHALIIRCPGCNELSELPLRPFGTREFWQMTGDPAEPATLSLSPSVHHAVPACGWHGFLRNGSWEPC